MTDHSDAVTKLARDLVRIDSRSFVSNHAISDRIEAALPDFELERLDYRDLNGVAKRALVAHRHPEGYARDGAGGLAFSGHMDTVPDIGWRSDPWSGRIADGWLVGLGSTDMKGPLAAAIVAACAIPAQVPVTLLLTTDEETTKAGAREIAQRSTLVRRVQPRAIVVVEPTRMIPMRGHRAHIVFTAVASGVQAHSSTGRGRNANWDLLPFLMEMRLIHDRLRTDPALQDPPTSRHSVISTSWWIITAPPSMSRFQRLPQPSSFATAPRWIRSPGVGPRSRRGATLRHCTQRGSGGRSARA